MQSRHVVSEEEVQRTLIGLCRDLRGVALAFNSRTGYMMLFDWMYPLYMWTGIKYLYVDATFDLRLFSTLK